MEEKEPYFQVPKSLFRSWRAGEINSTAFAVYMLMLDRYKISCLKENRKNFTDEDGEVFFVYAYNSLMEDLKISKKNSIANSIRELENLGFIYSKKGKGNATRYYITGNPKVTTTGNPKVTLIRINNKNNINNNNINNNNKENVVAGVIRQEIKFLIKTRNIKIENILKYCSDIERIKEVFRYADKYNKADGWIIACFRDNYTLKQEENNQNQEKDYDITIDEALKRSRKKR